METTKTQTALPTIAGILCIITGTIELMGFIFVASYYIIREISSTVGIGIADIFGATGGLFAILGSMAVLGGVYALRRDNFVLSMAGAIVALLPCNLLGLAAIILLALSKEEFK
jgi:hypothetical protein